MIFPRFLLFLLAIESGPQFGDAVAINNGIVGEPKIVCDSTSISLQFETLNRMEGHVFVKGRYDEDECNVDAAAAAGDDGRIAGINLRFETCGVERERSLNPKGVFVNSVVIISFHPRFLTKIDRAFKIQCFYMEADKTVSQELEVSDFSALTTNFQTEIVPMPLCQYEIRDGGPNGEKLRHAVVGQQIYHTWTCDTETDNVFCMTVHSCFVSDLQGERQLILDENGCTIDEYLLGNIDYPSDLMAGKEAHVFKFADRTNVKFDCQITILVKEPNENCPRSNCPPGNVVKRRKRNSRNLPKKTPDKCGPSENCADVSARFSVLPLDVDQHNLPNNTNRILGAERDVRKSSPLAEQEEEFCLTHKDFGYVMGFLLLCSLILTAALLISGRRDETDRKDFQERCS